MIRATTMSSSLTSARVLRGRRSAWVTTRGNDGEHETVPMTHVLDRARRLAQVVIELGVRPGEAVATWVPNDRSALEMLLGVPLAGAVLHPLNPALPDATLTDLLAATGDRLILCHPSALSRVRRLVPEGCRVVATDETLERRLAAADPATSLPDVPEDHPFAIVHTSGTTGRPKAVVHSHRAVWLHALSAGLMDGFRVSRHDTVLSIVPTYHALAIGLPLAAVLHGATLVLPGRTLEPHALVELIAITGTTLTGGLSSMFAALLDDLDARPFPPVVAGLTIVAGGNALTRSVVDGFAAHGVDLVHTWGMTETGPLATTHRATPGARDPHVPLGQAVGLVEIRVVGDDGQPLAWDGAAQGELQVRGPWVTGKYADAADGERFSADGWLRTGDRVTIDPDGSVHLLGRYGDGLRIGDRWIGPASLERCIQVHDAVSDVAVIGVPDRHLGERPAAFVVLAGPCPDVRRLVPGDLLPPKIPIDVFAVSHLPRGATGKLDRAALRHLASGPPAAV